MKDVFDVHEEYERIFGVEKRNSLYSEDDEEYNSLRLLILDTDKKEGIRTKQLPFEGVKLYPYDEYIRTCKIKKYKELGYRIFYIKKYVDEKLVSFAAAYFDSQKSRFIVIRESYFPFTSCYKQLLNNEKLEDRVDIIKKLRREDNTIILNDNLEFRSASIAASYILGKLSSFREWKDKAGNTLDAYYIKYKTYNIEEDENKIFEKILNSDAHSHNITTEVSIQSNVNTQVHLHKKEANHIFSIIIAGTCNVTGYVNEANGKFVITKGSYFPKTASESFLTTQLGISRQRFIEAACFEIGNTYEVKEDIQCLSAEAAASYVMGREVTDLYWKDDDNKSIKDIYPNVFTSANDNTQQLTNIVDSLSQPITQIINALENREDNTYEDIHYFYINSTNSIDDTIRARGYYIPSLKQFVIKGGSLVSSLCSSSFIATPQGLNRASILTTNCIKTRFGYRLTSDYTFKSPSAAASFALGKSANGWLSWKDTKGKTLDAVYRQ